MAITVVKNLTDISACENTTSWSGAPTAGTTLVREGTNALGAAVSATTSNFVYTGAPLTTPVNMTNQRIYIWASVAGVLDTKVNGGIGIIIGDGTNQRAYYVGGQDDLGFQVGVWSCFVLDCSNLPSNFATITGVSAPNITSINAVGIRFKTLSKAQGTSLNCFWDMVRYGTGITVYGGTSGTPIGFIDIATADASTAAGAAYGIIRKIQTGVYGIQGNITFGDSSGTNTFYFKDSDSVIIIEDHVQGAGTPTDISFTVTSNATATTSHFELGVAVGSGDTQSGRNGVTFKNANTTQPVNFDASNANLLNFIMYGGGFSGLNKTSTTNLKFSSNSTNAPNHILSGVTFDRATQTDIGLVPTRECVFSGTSSGNGALLWSSSINIKNSQFIANTYGIQMPSTGTFTFTGLTFSGNTTDDINNTSGGSITINAAGGSNPGTATGTTTINNAVTISILVQNILGSPIKNARVAIYKTSSIVAGTELLNTLTDATGVASTSYNYVGNQAIIIRVRAETPNLATPINTTFTQGTGTLGAGTYYYRVSATNDLGETLASTETSLTITAGHGVNVNWRQITGATGYKIYGRTTGAEQFIASVSGGSTLTYLDNGSITPSGALPASNTSGTTRYVNTDASGTITSSGFSTTFTMLQDTVAASNEL